MSTSSDEILELKLASDRQASAACGPGYTEPFGCYRLREFVAKLFDDYGHPNVGGVSLLPGTLGFIKEKLDDELEKRPSMRLATVFKLDGWAPRAPRHFDDGINLLRPLVFMLILWFVLRKRDFKDNADKIKILLHFIVALCVLFPISQIQLDVNTLYFRIIICLVIITIIFFFEKFNFKQPNIISIKIFLSILPFIILVTPCISQYTFYQMLVIYAPSMDIIFAWLQMHKDLRSPLYSSVLYYYFLALIVHRIYCIFKCMYLYYTSELDFLELYLHLMARFLYFKAFMFLKKARENDRLTNEVGTFRTKIAMLIVMLRVNGEKKCQEEQV